MGTTPHGAPYPDGTGKVVDGDNAIKALAEWIDPRSPWKVYATSGGYTTNSFGGIILTVPFTAVLGVAQLRTSAGTAVYLQSSSGPPPAGQYWLNAFKLSDNTPQINTFLVVDVIVMGQ
jgi:hypothetical protein